MFQGITEFLAVGDSEGFSAAARRLGVSVSHVSRQIAALESRLGIRLVARTTRKVRLTNEGREYYQRCLELAQAMEDANLHAAKKTAQLEGQLRISAGGEFAANYIVPALTQFAAQHKQLNIDIDFNSRNINFIDDGFDFAIRYGELADSNLIARKLLTRSLIAAASPDYLKKNGTPKHPRDLKQHQCLIANSDVWKFNEKDRNIDIHVSGHWRSNHGKAIVHACEQGLGIAYMPRSSFYKSIQEKKLKPILKPYWTQQVSTWIVYPDKHFMPLRARRAIEYLLEYFKNWHE